MSFKKILAIVSQLRSWHSLSDEVFYHLSIWEVLTHGLNRGFSFKGAGVEEWPIYAMRKNKRQTITAVMSITGNNREHRIRKMRLTF